MFVSNRLNKYLMVLPLSFLLLTGCGKKNDESAVKSLTDNNTVAVQVLSAGQRDIKLMKTYSGNFEGEEQANVSSKIAERIVSIKVKVGSAVREGEPIVFLDKSGAASQYYQAEAQYKNSAKDLERMKALLKEGAVSQQAVDGAQTAYNVAKANFTAAKSAVEIIAPISGVVAAVNMNVGDVANPGAPIATIAKTHNMKAVFSVGESEVVSLAVGQTVDIYSDQKPDLIQRGRVTQISKSADVNSRSFEVKAVFPNTKDGWFKPGMFCRVNTVLKSKNNCIAVPNQSVTNSDKGSYIFVINNNKAYMRNVETGISDGQYVEITKGLNSGETVVTLGMNNLKDGKSVRIENK